MELENIDQYVHTLFMIEDFTDDTKRLAKQYKKQPLMAKLFLASTYHFIEELKEQIVTYELSKTKKTSR